MIHITGWRCRTRTVLVTAWSFTINQWMSFRPKQGWQGYLSWISGFPLLRTLPSLLLCCSNYTLGWLGFWGGVLTDLYSVLKQGAEGAPFLYSSVNSLECRLLCLIFPPALSSFRPTQVGLGVTGTPWEIYIGFPFPHRIRITQKKNVVSSLLTSWMKKEKSM